MSNRTVPFCPCIHTAPFSPCGSVVPFSPCGSVVWSKNIHVYVWKVFLDRTSNLAKFCITHVQSIFSEVFFVPSNPFVRLSSIEAYVFFQQQIVYLVFDL